MLVAPILFHTYKQINRSNKSIYNVMCMYSQQAKKNVFSKSAFGNDDFKMYGKTP